MSTYTGLAPRRRSLSAVATNVNGVSDHLVAPPNAEGHHGDLQRVGPGSATDRESYPEIPRDGALELCPTSFPWMNIPNRARREWRSTSVLILLYWPTTSTI